MPTQLYSTSSSWIKQPEEQITTYPSGLIKTQQTFIYPGITTTYPPSPSESSVFPDPVLEILDSGFTRAVVNSYSRKITGGEMIDQGGGISAGVGTYAPPVKNKSKIVKTGNAVKHTLRKVEVKSGDDLLYLPKLFVETFSFEYLTGQIVVQGVSVESSLTPSAPSDTIEITLLKTPIGFSASNLYGKEWILSSFDAQNYGDIYETRFSYEGFAKMYIYIDLAGEGLSVPKPPPPTLP
jgi:hypothetical protein